MYWNSILKNPKIAGKLFSILENEKVFNILEKSNIQYTGEPTLEKLSVLKKI